jgi:hypothetical protein
MCRIWPPVSQHPPAGIQSECAVAGTIADRPSPGRHPVPRTTPAPSLPRPLLPPKSLSRTWGAPHRARACEAITQRTAPATATTGSANRHTSTEFSKPRGWSLPAARGQRLRPGHQLARLPQAASKIAPISYTGRWKHTGERRPRRAPLTTSLSPIPPSSWIHPASRLGAGLAVTLHAASLGPVTAGTRASAFGADLIVHTRPAFPPSTHNHHILHRRVQNIHDQSTYGAHTRLA